MTTPRIRPAVAPLTLVLVALTLLAPPVRALTTVAAPDPVRAARQGHSRVSLPHSPTSAAPLAPLDAASRLLASPCPMAHCDPQMSDEEPVHIPTAGVSVAWTFTPRGNRN